MTGTEPGTTAIAGAIDVHVHAIPEKVVKEAAAGLIPGLTFTDQNGHRLFRFPNMDPSPPVPESLLDFALMEEDSTSQGIELRMVGPWTDLMGYTLPEGPAGRWTRLYNTALVEECSNHRGMAALATVPLQFPSLAVAEMEKAKEIGCRGLVIGTDLPGPTLGSPTYDDVWAAASDLSMPVLLHPTFLRVPATLKTRGLKNAVGRAGATATTLADMIYSGVLERYPDLMVIASHGGGGFLPLLQRVLRNHELGWSETDVDVKASIARLYWDSVVLDPLNVTFLVETVGADHVLLGSDHPFPWESRPVETVVSASISDSDRRAILGGNARRLFGL